MSPPVVAVGVGNPWVVPERSVESVDGVAVVVGEDPASDGEDAGDAGEIVEQYPTYDGTVVERTPVA